MSTRAARHRRETAVGFGVGFFPGKGSMTGRVVIPIHDREGKLVAYAGRAIDGSEPKYKVPAGFHKSLELFNLHRAVSDGRDCVVIVEGFFDCMKVHQAGYASVALMGAALSERQEEVLAETFSSVVVMLDGDEPGREAAQVIASRLARRMFIKVINLPDGQTARSALVRRNSIDPRLALSPAPCTFCRAFFLKRSTGRISTATALTESAGP